MILWDGGNNDLSFMASDVYITIADAYRPGHEFTHHPGETNFRIVDLIVINKVDPVSEKNVAVIEENAKLPESGGQDRQNKTECYSRDAKGCKRHTGTGD